MKSFEVNFDGLVGPTHHYAGLAFGNIASMQHKSQKSNPKKAALQGLEKMKLMMDLGIKQAVLPPHPRPDISILKKFGFTGSDASVIEKAAKEAPNLFYATCASSFMWAANAATITPSQDSTNNLLNITPANLLTHFHRAIESSFTKKILQTIFHDPSLFKVHEPIFYFPDEGAANHTRFSYGHSHKGVHLFVYSTQENVKTFPARQSRNASESIVRNHQININDAIFAEQNPTVIDLGVFHNDVIATGNENLFLYHEEAFLNSHLLFDLLHRKLDPFYEIKISKDCLPLADAINSYLFNSQIVTLPNKTMAIIAPFECLSIQTAKQVIDSIIEDPLNPIKSIHYVDVGQSMHNGGGPACLRLRVNLNEKELKGMHQGVLLNETLYHQLVNWVEKHYREELTHEDLKDPLLYEETKEALTELGTLLKLENIYG